MTSRMLVTNARLYTQWKPRPWAEALVTQNGRILAIGTQAEMQKFAPFARTLDLHGALILPGFTDAHIHFYDLARRRTHVSLYETHSLDDFRDRVAAFHHQLPPNLWLLGYGWNESGWPQPRFPTRDDLDAVTGARPALLWRTDLHGAVANSAALEAAGIRADTPNPPAGIIEKDATGRPTGVLREAAITLVKKVIPPIPENLMSDYLLQTAADLHQLGITAVHDQRMDDTVDEGARALRLYTRLSAEGRLRLRISCNFERAQTENLIRMGLQSGFGNQWVRIGHIKLFADGSLGSQTAWMFSPYENDLHNTGLPLTPPVQVAEIIRQAHQHGLAISIHAIGDRAIHTVLDIFEETLGSGSAQPPLIPHRIEHVITLQPEDLPRLASLGLTASLQPIHCTDDMVNVDRLWGARGANTYRFKSLIESGTLTAFGSDAPVASPNPLWGIHAAVTRQNHSGKPSGGWYPAERLSVVQAVAAYTSGPMQAIGREDEAGRLAPGYLADMVVLDRDIFTIPPQDIWRTQVQMTLVGGEIVYRREEN